MSRNFKTRLMEKAKDVKSWFLKNNNKIDKPLAKLPGNKIQIINIRSEGGRIPTDLTDIKVSEHHKQVCAHKFNNLDEMDQILERTSSQNSLKK